MKNNRRFDGQIETVAASTLGAQYADEIERAIDRAKRPLTARDRWFRKQWYRAGALRRKSWQAQQGGREKDEQPWTAKNRATSAMRPQGCEYTSDE